MFEEEKIRVLNRRLDISSHNIAFSASNIHHASEQEIRRIIGTPVVEELIREDGQPVEPRFPKHLVRRAEWFEWFDEENEDIRLLDWGESFRVGEEPTHLAQPIDYKAPETIFTDHLDYRVDLWRAGLVVRLIFYPFYLLPFLSLTVFIFYPSTSNMLTSFQIYHMVVGYKPFMTFHEDASLVSQMIGFVEDLPDEWKGKWLKMKEESEESYDDVDAGEQISMHSRSWYIYMSRK